MIVDTTRIWQCIQEFGHPEINQTCMSSWQLSCDHDKQNTSDEN